MAHKTLTEKQLKANRENAKKAGTGRPLGSKSEKTLKREEALNQFRESVSKVAGTLFRDQFSLARGAQYLFRIDKEWVATSQTNKDKGYYRNKKPVLVTSPDEMLMYLEELAENNGDIADDKSEDASYYFLSARDPQNNAIDSMLDRTFGRAKSELDVNVKFPKPIYGGQAIQRLNAGERKLPPKKVKVTVLPLKAQDAHDIKAA